MERSKGKDIICADRQSAELTIKHTCAIEISFSESNRKEIEFEFESWKWENNTLALL